MLEELQVQPNPQGVVDGQRLHPLLRAELAEPLPHRRHLLLLLLRWRLGAVVRHWGWGWVRGVVAFPPNSVWVRTPRAYLLYVHGHGGPATPFLRCLWVGGWIDGNGCVRGPGGGLVAWWCGALGPARSFRSIPKGSVLTSFQGSRTGSPWGGGGGWTGPSAHVDRVRGLLGCLWGWGWEEKGCQWGLGGRGLIELPRTRRFGFEGRGKGRRAPKTTRTRPHHPPGGATGGWRGRRPRVVVAACVQGSGMCSTLSFPCPSKFDSARGLFAGPVTRSRREAARTRRRGMMADAPPHLSRKSSCTHTGRSPPRATLALSRACPGWWTSGRQRLQRPLHSIIEQAGPLCVLATTPTRPA